MVHGGQAHGSPIDLRLRVLGAYDPRVHWSFFEHSLVSVASLPQP